MWRNSFSEYIKALGFWWFIIIIPTGLDIIGIYQIINNTQVLGIPSWVLIILASVLFLIIPFIAFHKMRVRLKDIADEKTRKFHRLILDTRDTASKVVLLHKAANSITVEVENAYTDFIASHRLLFTEAEIEKCTEAIDKFVTFSSIHVGRFLGFIGPIIGGDKEKIEMDELSFVGHIAAYGDEALENIKMSLTK